MEFEVHSLQEPILEYRIQNNYDFEDWKKRP